jgi:hypothetical protein
MKQQVSVTLTVSFDDSVLQPDAEEALVSAVGNLQRMLSFMPTIKGKTGKGREVSFKVVDVQLPR